VRTGNNEASIMPSAQEGDREKKVLLYISFLNRGRNEVEAKRVALRD